MRRPARRRTPELKPTGISAKMVMVMATVNEHGRLIAAAAKAALTPLGCRRSGQSRAWISDERYWVLTVYFEPSGWQKGSYLQIGVTWLWFPSPARVLNVNYRVPPFVAFENVGQFQPLVEAMAANAAQEVVAVRERFRSLNLVYRYLMDAVPENTGWPVYNAAVAAGLVGDIDGARRLFGRIATWPTDGYDWQASLKAQSSEISAALDDADAFRATVYDIISLNRRCRGLPPDPECLQATYPKAAPAPYR